MLRIVIAASGAARLGAAREFLRRIPTATEVVVVSPNRGAADDLVRSITAESSATFGLHRFSVVQLAGKLAAGELATRGLTPISTLAAHATAARVSYEHLTREGLPYFAPIADYPGFAPSLASTFQELRLGQIAPGDLTGDLSRLFASYNETLEANAFSDLSVLYELAAHAIATNPPRLVTAPLLLLDVRAESKVQRQFLRRLIEVSPDVLATVHASDERTKEFFRSFAGAAVVTVPQPPPSSSLERLRVHLFSPGALPRGEFDESVVFFSAPGEGREAVEIARAVLEQARRGVPFDEMAVLLRTPGKYQPHLEAAFERAGIPCYFARGSRRPDPAGRALLALLACAAEGLSARRFGEYLSLGQVPDSAATDLWRPPEDENGESFLVETDEPLPDVTLVDDESASYAGNLREPYRWEELLVEAAVIGGKERWSRRLRGLAAELRRKLQEVESEEPESSRADVIRRQLTRLGHLHDFALPIIGRLDALQTCRSWSDWMAALRQLVGAALRRPGRVLEVLAELEPMAEIEPVTIEEVRVTLAERLSSLEVRASKRRFGRVFIAPMDQAAGRSFRVVFVPGVVERGFPQRIREDPLLLDDARQAISPDLDVSADRANEERFRLQIAIGAAGDALYVSYPRIDAAQGRARVASFYALDIIRAVTGRIPDHEELERTASRIVGARLAWPAPSAPREAIDELEHDLAVLRPRLETRNREEQAGRARYLLDLNSYLAQSLRARYGRWEKENWNHYDGITRSTEGIRAVLEQSSLLARPYSPSALQRYAACPYQFFLSAILRLEPREEPQPPVRLDPLTRGLMIHAMHAATLRRLKSRGLLPLVADRLSQAESVLNDVADEIAARWEEELAPAIPRVWRDEITMIRTDLRLWLRDIAAEPDRWIAENCELAFGLQPSPDYDESSRSDPVRLPGGWLLRGSVDLIERRAVIGDLRVIDYKTGSNRTRDDLIIGGGEQLQPMLYALAIEAIFDVPVAFSRLFFSTSKGGFTKRDVDITERNKQTTTALLEQIERAVTSGFLPPAPRPKARGKWVACDFCDFITVCGPYEPIRSQKKSPERLAPLVRLRDEP